MLKLKPESEINMRNYLESFGFDVQPIKKTDKIFKVALWKGDAFLGEGNFEYDNYKKAVSETIKRLYIQVFNKKNSY